MGQAIQFPDQNEDFAAINDKLARRRKLAESLVQSAMQDNGGAGYHGGHVYAVGNQLGNVAQIIGGTLMGHMADNDQQDLYTRQRQAEESALGAIPSEGPERTQAQLRAFQQMPSLRDTLKAQMGLDEHEATRQFRQQEAEANRLEKSEQEAANRVARAEEGAANRQNRVDLRQMPAVVVHSGGGKSSEDIELDRQIKEERLRQMREGKPPSPDKPLTEAQGNAYLFGTRADAAHKILDEVGTNYSPMKVSIAGAVEKVPGVNVGANAVLSDNEQKVFQAQRDFVNAVLRKESGAAIAQSEFDNARKQYFPQPGDSATVIAQKKANRETAIKGLARIVGPQGADIGKPKQSQPTVVRTGTRNGVRVEQLSDGTIREVK